MSPKILTRAGGVVDAVAIFLTFNLITMQNLVAVSHARVWDTKNSGDVLSSTPNLGHDWPPSNMLLGPASPNIWGTPLLMPIQFDLQWPMWHDNTFGFCRPNCMGISRGVPKSLGMLGPAPLRWEHIWISDPLETRPSSTSYATENFVILC